MGPQGEGMERGGSERYSNLRNCIPIKKGSDKDQFQTKLRVSMCLSRFPDIFCVGGASQRILCFEEGHFAPIRPKNRPERYPGMELSDCLAHKAPGVACGDWGPERDGDPECIIIGAAADHVPVTDFSPVPEVPASSAT